MSDPLVEKHAILRNVMCGVFYPVGWRNIVDKMATELAQIPGVKISQVKSKFGRLRVYIVWAGDDKSGYASMIRADDIVSKAEELSSRTCESCGATCQCESCEGHCSFLRKSYWIRTMCQKCFKAQ